MIDFTIDPRVEELRKRVRAFVHEFAIPAEERRLDDALRSELQAAAHEQGLFAPQVSRELGGLGLDHRGRSVIFEEAGYSLYGPQALNCAAPDEGNMHLLEVVASAEQKERYLRPLAAGEIRSCFSMTEPAPGAGSDPTALTTTATKVADGWRIDGRKHFISGANGAAFTICMARTDEEIRGDRGATMFLVDGGNPGYRVGRELATTDSVFVGGHSVVDFVECVVPDDAVLGEVGLGYRYAQVRLAPARLTHSMRWLGLARRALDVAVDRASERELFGTRQAELGMTQAMVADSVIDIEASRLLVQRACWVLDSGGDARDESSIAKVFVAEAVWRVIDRAVQLLGGLGVTDDFPLARFLNEVRPFRIYDGPSETHRWAIARRAVKRRARERDT